MINEIKMEDVASYKAPTSLLTNKKINLLYGLNGTGKSTLSAFLQDQDDLRFKSCKVTFNSAAPILVYNQNFIQENFYESLTLKGIFSLSKENKIAEQKITEANKRLSELQKALDGKKQDKLLAERERDAQKQQAIEKIWNIKSEYAGGDRVLEYCLDGLKGQKEKLFSYVSGLPKPFQLPAKTDLNIKTEVESLTKDTAQPQELLPLFKFAEHQGETAELLSQVIVGNEDSIVSDLIEKLQNSDWVREGIAYVPQFTDEQSGQCPFCQELTVTPTLVENIKSYFDENYQASIKALQDLEQKYIAAITLLPSVHSYVEHPLAGGFVQGIQLAHSKVARIFNGNLQKISQKISNPRVPQILENSTEAIAYLNENLEKVNQLVVEFNDRLKNKSETLEVLKKEFWDLMRWNYDQTIDRYAQDWASSNKKIEIISDEVEKLETSVSAENENIRSAQKETINIDEAVTNINSGLVDLAIHGFSIKKHSDSLYRLVRTDASEDAFRSLSEGERMIISFLYFCELCKGRVDANDTGSKKIVIIDDPISSLSHIYIFNIAQLIKSLFFRTNRFQQIFVLTHSLYFFYELTDTDHERRGKNQNLFRLIKNSNGSQILQMKYEEIQNDYQSYWTIVNDKNQPPALIANCMRNIVEYFFNFVRKKDLNNVFQIDVLQGIKHQAFCRYINRESHSLGQNIFDLKEFDYDIFREGLRIVFTETGFSEHYEQMTKM